MSEVLRRYFRGYEVAAVSEVSEQALAQLIENIEGKTFQGTGVLEGRAGVRFHQLEPFGEVAVKEYQRGGILRRFVRRRYLRFGKSRPAREYEILAEARAAGVRVPQPLLYLTKGGLWYRGWLVTQRIAEKRNLIELSRQSEESLPAVMSKLTEQVEHLIRRRIFHVDLHPGNVVVGEDGELYLLDFDKAHHFSGNIRKLRQSYLCRWRRAVIKHGLPDLLTELMGVGLRKIDERI